MTPQISLGMPVYNGAVYIREALDSLLEQTFTDFELIITDNASSDETQEICEAYAARDARIQYVRNSENVGAAANYNKAFHLSSGKYFKWAAHDDICKPTFLAQCYDALEADESRVLCSPKALIINEQGEVTDHYTQQLIFTDDSAYQRFVSFFDGVGFHPIFGLIRRDALANTGLIGKFEMADRVLLGELVLHGKFVEVADELFLRRKHPGISHVANATDRTLAAWFDPSNANKILMPRWQRYFEYLKAIYRSPLPPNEQWRCTAFMLRFILQPQKVKRIAGDVAKALLSIPSVVIVRMQQTRPSDQDSPSQSDDTPTDPAQS